MTHPASFRDRVLECIVEYIPEMESSQIKDDMSCGRHLGIDSHMGLELACEFSSRLGLDIPATDNPLVIRTKGGIERMRTVGELVEHLSSLLPN